MHKENTLEEPQLSIYLNSLNVQSNSLWWKHCERMILALDNYGADLELKKFLSEGKRLPNLGKPMGNEREPEIIHFCKPPLRTRAVDI